MAYKNLAKAAAYFAAYYRSHREESREKSRRYKQRNSAKVSDANKKYADEHRDEILAKARAKYLETKVVVRQKNRIAYFKNKKTAQIRSKRNYAARREKRLKRSREWYENNREQRLLKSREWAKNNPEKQKHRVMTYRARRLGARGHSSAAQMEARISLYGGLCAYCLGPASTIDHVIPLSRGGTNWPANLRPACKSCNSKKHIKKINEWKKR